jgi:hypothetical protein
VTDEKRTMHQVAAEAAHDAYWSVIPPPGNAQERELALWMSVSEAVADVIGDSDLGDCGCGASAAYALSRLERCRKCGYEIPRHHPRCTKEGGS